MHPLERRFQLSLTHSMTKSRGKISLCKKRNYVKRDKDGIDVNFYAIEFVNELEIIFDVTICLG